MDGDPASAVGVAGPGAAEPAAAAAPRPVADAPVDPRSTNAITSSRVIRPACPVPTICIGDSPCLRIISRTAGVMRASGSPTAITGTRPSAVLAAGLIEAEVAAAVVVAAVVGASGPTFAFAAVVETGAGVVAAVVGASGPTFAFAAGFGAAVPALGAVAPAVSSITAISTP